jgi:hypothetical protein
MSETPQPLITPYKMMMKRQFQLLQYLLGLRPSHPPETAILCDELSNSSIKDIVFVCVDTEFTSNGQKLCGQEFQLGIATLDTRGLLSLISQPQPANPKRADILQTRNFCVASPEYCLKVWRRYAFGESETVRLDELKLPVIPTRDIVLVTHDGSNDLRFIKELGIDIRPICTLDTQMVAQSPLQLTHKASLKELLTILECPSQYMHVAGNDANFTLRALLMLSVRDLDPAQCTKAQLTAMSTFKAVAQFPRPKNAIEKKTKGPMG